MNLSGEVWVGYHHDFRMDMMQLVEVIGYYFFAL